MMDAIHIELSQDLLTNRSPVTGDLCLWGRDLWVNRDKFFQVVRGAGFQSPKGSAQDNWDRFRLFVRVPGKPGMRGVYYVGGYRDDGPNCGVVHLYWDEDQGHVVPRRREAIMATRAKG